MAAIKRFEEALANNELYEAFQLVQSILNREISRRQYSKAVKLASSCSSKLREHGGPGLACDLGLEVVKQFERSGVVASSVFVEQLCSMSKPCGPASGKLLTAVLRWMKESEKLLRQQHAEGEDSDEKENEEKRKQLEGLMMAYSGVYLLAGEAKLAEGAVGAAQTFFVLCGDNDTAIEKLAEMLGDWRVAGYVGERDMFPLRVVLMMLSKNSVVAADKFVMLVMIYDLMDDPPPAAGVQLAYFLVEAAKDRNNDFYELVKGKYSLVVRRDAAFATLVEAIDEVVFGQTKRVSGNGMFGKLLEGLV
eukprot:Lankesteria_metandrocarpae@DN6149_c0_g1_i1.p1